MPKRRRFAQDLRIYATLPRESRSLVAEAFHRLIVLVAPDRQPPPPAAQPPEPPEPPPAAQD